MIEASIMMGQVTKYADEFCSSPHDQPVLGTLR
jgi:hypothetical protein